MNLEETLNELKHFGGEFLENWAGDLSNYVIADSFVNFTFKTPLAADRMAEWTKSKEEWTGRAGWNLLAHMAMKSANLSDDYFIPYIEFIERSLHSSANKTKDAMNSALMAIGSRSAPLRQRALATARRIGKINVDHGKTNCKNP